MIKFGSTIASVGSGGENDNGEPIGIAKQPRILPKTHCMFAGSWGKAPPRVLLRHPFLYELLP